MTYNLLFWVPNTKFATPFQQFQKTQNEYFVDTKGLQ